MWLHVCLCLDPAGARVGLAKVHVMGRAHHASQPSPLPAEAETEGQLPAYMKTKSSPNIFCFIPLSALSWAPPDVWIRPRKSWDVLLGANALTGRTVTRTGAEIWKHPKCPSTLVSGLGIEPVSWCSRAATNPVPPQWELQELQKSLVIVFHEPSQSGTSLSKCGKNRRDTNQMGREQNL